MNPWLRGLLALGLLVVCVQGSRAQQSTAITWGVGFPSSEPLGPGPTPVTNEPYSATTESETSQTLADGTHVNRKMVRQQTYRDSQGRTRGEQYVPTSLRNNEKDRILASIRIFDPVAHVGYLLNPRDHTVRQFAMPVPPPPRSGGTSRPAPPRPGQSTKVVEDLGTQVMEGLVVDGQRITLTIPTDAQGNDRPITNVTEEWFSKELQLFVLIKHSDPRSGENTIRTTNIDRSEPDPSLFQVPADYTIKPQ